ncbi:hypothetical protein Forpi1262_v011132 [Fusarium oxysporum f. sp. raphani]|uniref:Uncharacterized protein n=1 Tax=Fusarium oxysporum f. sp. raphani TaxID=96318 RepID=A0A8J5UBW8_FUSOX|nr:hypothetical protein Forpi1262_v011132 [Fusarium oxysporum f. sp. raphani]
MVKCTECDGFGLKGNAICAGCNGTGSRDSSFMPLNMQFRPYGGHTLHGRTHDIPDDIPSLACFPPDNTAVLFYRTWDVRFI